MPYLIWFLPICPTSFPMASTLTTNILRKQNYSGALNTHFLFLGLRTPLFFNWNPLIYSISLQPAQFPRLSSGSTPLVYSLMICLIHSLMIFYLFHENLLNIQYYAI